MPRRPSSVRSSATSAIRLGRQGPAPAARTQSGRQPRDREAQRQTRALPTVAELAEHLGASKKTFSRRKNSARLQPALTRHRTQRDGDKKSQTLADYVGQNDSALELLEDRANLERAFEVLSAASA